MKHSSYHFEVEFDRSEMIIVIYYYYLNSGFIVD
jgi:hypothetical protein